MATITLTPTKVPELLLEGDHCGACGSMKYYGKI